MAEPKKAPAKAGESAATEVAKSHQFLRVVAKRAGFRRAGFEFGSEPKDVPLSEIDEDQFKQLTTEPMLVTTLVELVPAVEAKAGE